MISNPISVNHLFAAPIQAILLFLILILGVYLLRRSRSRLVGRVVMILLLLMLSIFVLFPEFTTWIANRFGVGRGADFLLYVFALFVLYALVLIYTRLRDQDRKITQITRILAIRDAQKPGGALSISEGRETNQSKKGNL
jgi:small membrane protein